MRERIPFQPQILIERFLELLDHRLWRLGHALPMDRACSVAALVAAQTAEFILADAIARFQAVLTRAARRPRSRDGGLRNHKRGGVELGPGACMKQTEWLLGGHAERSVEQKSEIQSKM